MTEPLPHVYIFLNSSLQGMYYSYYKTIAESKDFFDGMDRLSRDNLSEYGNVIDATKKYNLLPEVTVRSWMISYDVF